jgi:hypothetical protein
MRTSRRSSTYPRSYPLMLAFAVCWLLAGAAPAMAGDDTPVLTLTSPAQNGYGQPDVRVTGQCVDDGPECTILVSAGAQNTILAVASGSVDTVVTPPDGGTTLTVRAIDSAGQSVEVTRTIFVVSSRRLAPEATFPGRILAVDAARALVVDEAVSPRVLRLVNRAANTSQILWTGSTAMELVGSGYLAPNGGAIFTTRTGVPPSNVATLREWRGGTLGTIGEIALGTLVVKYTWALFVEYPCCTPERLVLRDLTTGVNTIVSTTAGEMYHDVTPDGRVVFWTLPAPYEVYEFNPTPPSTTPLTAAAPLSSFRTVADGVNVVFLRSAANSSFSLVLRTAGGVEEVLATGLHSSTVPGQDYQAVGGWTAFMRPGAGGSPDVWVREPNGTQRQVSSTGLNHPGIESMNENGDIVFYGIPFNELLPARYLARANGTVVELGVPSGMAVFMDGEWFVAAGTSLFAVRSDVPERSILAEGATGIFFSTDIAILNPGTEAVAATIRYLREGASEIQETRNLPARSRTTIHADDVPGLEGAAVSTHVDAPDGANLVVERLMTWDDSGYGGHLGNAVSAPRLRWMFAEGAQGFFSTFFLIANSSAVPATVRLTFLVELGTPVVHTMTVPAASRKTFSAGELADLVNTSFATVVESDVPVVAERAMYFGASPLWLGGHGSVGVPEPSTSWFHAEGATGSLFDTFILLANPHAKEVAVTLTYTTDSGGIVMRMKTLPPFSRLTINIEDEAPELASVAVSTSVSAYPLPIISERAMYWGTTGAGWREAHNSFGVTTTGTKWGLAEGRVGGPRGYQTYVLVSNALSNPAELKVTFIREDGMAFERSYTVGPRQRYNINAGDVPELANSNFSTIVEALGLSQITVESAIYWNVNGVVWEGGGNTLATRLQ